MMSFLETNFTRFNLNKSLELFSDVNDNDFSLSNSKFPNLFCQRLDILHLLKELQEEKEL